LRRAHDVARAAPEAHAVGEGDRDPAQERFARARPHDDAAFLVDEHRLGGAAVGEPELGLGDLVGDYADEDVEGAGRRGSERELRVEVAGKFVVDGRAAFGVAQELLDLGLGVEVPARAAVDVGVRLARQRPCEPVGLAARDFGVAGGRFDPGVVVAATGHADRDGDTAHKRGEKEAHGAIIAKTGSLGPSRAA